MTIPPPTPTDLAMPLTDLYAQKAACLKQRQELMAREGRTEWADYLCIVLERQLSLIRRCAAAEKKP